MKIQIITYYPQLYASIRLKEELEALDFQVQCICPEDLTQQDMQTPKILRLGRYHYHENLVILKKHQGPFYNGIESFILARNKWFTYQKLFNKIHLPVSNKNGLPFPCLLKLEESTHGEGVYLIQNQNEMPALQEPYFFQEFIQESAGHDYRVLMLESDLIGAIERKNEKNFRANSVYGNQAQPFTPTPELLEAARTVMKELGLFYSALDFVKNKYNEFLLLEANASPGFQQFEAVTKINFAKAFALRLKERIKIDSNSR